MDKKYRVVIPKEYHQIVIPEVRYLDGKVIDEGPISTGKMLAQGFYIPLQFLQEIKEPVVLSAEEILATLSPDSLTGKYHDFQVRHLLEIARKEFRKERDNELRPVIEAAEEVTKNSISAGHNALGHSIYVLSEALENFSPLED